MFGFEPRLELSTRPEKRVGTDEMWDRAEAALEAALVEEGLEFEVNEGDGAFYGPKIDLHMTDSIGRSWQLGTVQLDYSMPERFDLTYTGADNEDHRPVMIHRALMGSFERFIGILIEHYAGEFPLWLAPVQALVLPIADRHVEYAPQVARRAARRRPAGRGRRPRRVGRAARSATASCARCPTCWWWATRRPSRARWPSAATARATWAPSRWPRSPSNRACFFFGLSSILLANEGQPHHAPPPLTRSCPLPTLVSLFAV